MSRAAVNMTPEAPMLDECFSDAPIQPRRLHFSESASSLDTPEDLKLPEASSSFYRALGKALFLLVARYAGVE